MTCAVCAGNGYVKFDGGGYMTCTACNKLDLEDKQPMEREELLSHARALITGPRAKAYGNAHKNFSNIAAGWSVIFDAPVTPRQVALAMDWVKTARLVQSPAHYDSWADKAGYAALGWECGE